MDETGYSREQLLIRAFVGLADTLVDDYDVIDLLDRLVGYSVELLQADAAGILLADPQRPVRVVASSNEQTEWIELMQLQADQGPCVECFRTGTPVSITDLTDTAPRWPRLAAALADQDAYRSVHALPPRSRSGEVLNEQLQTALNSRILIEQAKGVLAQLGHLTMDTAFDRLRSYARRHNLRLSAVAQQVIDTDLAAAVLAAPATTRALAARKR